MSSSSDLKILLSLLFGLKYPLFPLILLLKLSSELWFKFLLNLFICFWGRLLILSTIFLGITAFWLSLVIIFIWFPSPILSFEIQLFVIAFVFSLLGEADIFVSLILLILFIFKIWFVLLLLCFLSFFLFLFLFFCF